MFCEITGITAKTFETTLMCFCTHCLMGDLQVLMVVSLDTSSVNDTVTRDLRVNCTRNQGLHRQPSISER